MKDKDYIRIHEIIVHASPNSTIDDGLRSAILLAMEEMQVVKFTHNAKTYTVDPEETIRNIPFEEKI